MKTQSEIEQLKQDFAASKEAALQDYFTFLKFQSISSEPSFKPQTQACCDWVASYFRKIGFHVDIWPTDGHPTIFASYDQAGPKQPTLLIYNHYDVQPVDPVELWETPPFEPSLRNGQVYARGAQDNKGQCFYVLHALKTMMKRNGSLPINVKLCIEGEEECGSAGLSSIVEKKKSELKADYLAIVDLGMLDAKTPAVTLGIRGLVALDVEAIGTKTDLHSGSHGGLAYNPNRALVKILSKLHDDTGKVTVPGFYDTMAPVPESEMKQIHLEFDPRHYEAEFGVKPTGGETAYSHLERNWLRPTLEINGISGGYAGEGVKTVIPAKARAKISCRLVPNQDPEQIGHLVADYLESLAPPGIAVKAKVHKGHGKAVRSNASSKVAQAFAKAYEEIFQTECKYVFCGASIPVVTDLAHSSGAEVVMVGLGLEDDCIHAPNEHFGIDRIENGFLSIARVLQLLSLPNKLET